MQVDDVGGVERREPTWSPGFELSFREATSNLAAQVGSTIRARRKELGLSQATLARRVEQLTGSRWHQTAIAKTEAGTRPLALAEAYAFALALGMFSLASITEGSSLDDALKWQFVERQRRIRERRTEAVAAWLDDLSPGSGEEFRSQIAAVIEQHVAERTGVDRNADELEYLMDVQRAETADARREAEERLDRWNERNQGNSRNEPSTGREEPR